MKKSNQKGMGLIEVMVASAVGLIVVFGITSMMTDMFKSQRAIQSKDASQEVLANVRSLLADPIICTASFKNGSPLGAGFTRTQIVDAGTPANIKYQTGINYLNNLITLTNIAVSNYAQDSAANPKVGKADLILTLNKVGSSVGGSVLIRNILLQVTLDASNNIQQCHSLGSADSLWQITPTNKANINYQAGNVGVGVADPQSLLNVAGDLRSDAGTAVAGGACSPSGATIAAAYGAAGQNLICTSGVWAVVTSGGTPEKHGSYRKICTTYAYWNNITSYSCAPSPCGAGDAVLASNQCALTGPSNVNGDYFVTCEIWCLH